MIPFPSHPDMIPIIPPYLDSGELIRHFVSNHFDSIERIVDITRSVVEMAISHLTL